MVQSVPLLRSSGTERQAQPRHTHGALPGAPTAADLSAAARDGRRRRWTINGDFVHLAPAGVERYAREVTLALDRLVLEGHPLTEGLDLDVVAPGCGRRPLQLEAIPVRIVPEFARPRLPQVWAQIQLPRHVPGGLLSFCNLAPVAVRRQIVCIHDLHTRLMPDSYGRLFRLAHRVILPVLGRRAAAITTVSELSRGHLAAFGVAAADRITVTYNGSDHVARWDGANGTLPAPARPFVLCLGRDQRYKNLDLLLGLAPLLDARGLDVWMAGDVGVDTILSLVGEMPPNLRLLGRISDDDFRQGLSGALCFLFPSRIEGFGLPAVEAMASGCPVVASTAPCLPEICGAAALLADPDDLPGWAAAIAALQSDLSLRARMTEAGLARAKHFRWRRVAETYLELAHGIDAASTPRPKE